MHVRLVPPELNLGWTPYAWLIYLALFVAYPAARRAGPAEWLATCLALAAFLALYFRGFWIEGPGRLPVVWGIVAIGAIFAPFNPGASCFFVYGAAFLGEIGRPAVGARWLLAILFVVAAETYLLGLPAKVWIPAVVFSIVVGGSNIHFAEARRADARLTLAHEEIAHLASVAERERIARDLHDVLGHTLSLVAIKSDLAAKLAERDPVRAAAEIRDVGRISREALAEVRRAVYGFRAATLRDEVANARRALEAAGVEADVETAPIALPAEREAALALALREAVTNVVRHARARRCRVRVEGTGAEAMLEVADDGVGGDAPDGAGLAGMRERVSALGGSIERDGRGGTRLRVSMPVRAQVEATVGGTAP